MTAITLMDAGTVVIRAELASCPIQQVDSVTDSCKHFGAEQEIAIVRRLGSELGPIV